MKKNIFKSNETLSLQQVLAKQAEKLNEEQLKSLKGGQSWGTWF